MVKFWSFKGVIYFVTNGHLEKDEGFEV
jgi:hypothetical protein